MLWDVSFLFSRKDERLLRAEKAKVRGFITLRREIFLLPRRAFSLFARLLIARKTNPLNCVGARHMRRKLDPVLPLVRAYAHDCLIFGLNYRGLNAFIAGRRINSIFQDFPDASLWSGVSQFEILLLNCWI